MKRANLRVLSVAMGLVLLYGASSSLEAGGETKVFTDAKRGFTTRVPDTFTQNPPKPGAASNYEAAEFYDDQAKYKSSGSANPQFRITWWVTPKVTTTSGGATPPATPEGGADQPPDKMPTRQEAEDMFGPKSLEEDLDPDLERNTRLFGDGIAPLGGKWAGAKTGKTTKQKIEFRYLEFNATKSKKKEDPAPIWYFFVAKIAIERPTESIVVGFSGYCAIPFADKLGPAYLNIVKNFEAQDTGEASSAREEVPTDPDKYREYLKRTKVIAGWKYMDSPKKQYALIYAEGVDAKLINTIAEQVESLRGQVYELVFPPDKPIRAISVIRVCKDREQYQAYHAPGGTAGYWSSWDGELVFFEDTNNKKDSLRVLYHEAFHQYIYYSVGAMSPHSWFNEGNGDFFYGHNFKDGRWQLGKSLDRTDTAAKVKREKRVPPLKEWLHWSQAEYYGRTKSSFYGTNEAGLTALENYALGWEFIYFLRTTKKPEYQGILDRYFNALKGLVTAAREERRKAREKGRDKSDTTPIPTETAEEEDLANRMHETDWLAKAIAEGFKGVDLDQLYKDWMDFSP